jgi:hypothetical protein
MLAVLPHDVGGFFPCRPEGYRTRRRRLLEQAKKEGLPLESFTVHDLRRPGSTLLNELGFNSDWIEQCLARDDVVFVLNALTCEARA